MNETHDPCGATLEDNARSAARSLRTSADRAIDRAETAVDVMGARASAAAAKLGDDAKDRVAIVSYGAQKIVDEISPYLRKHPYIVLAATAVTGVLIGLLAQGSKSRDS